MNLRDRNKIIRKIFDNLRESSKEISSQPHSENKKMVLEKYISTLGMLYEGSEAIKQMIKDDLEGGINGQESTMEPSGE